MAVVGFLHLGFALTLIFLVIELRVLKSDPEGIQGSMCSLTKQLREAFPLSETGMGLLAYYHKSTSSFLWMKLSSAISFVHNYDEGTELYLYVIFAHIVKNFSKSFIQSPRGFWFCNEDEHGTNPSYCGSGNSLPSGHLMMSVLFFLAVYFQKPSRRMLAIFVFLEVFIFVEVIYLGTHSVMDNVVGITFGIAWFCLYRIWKEKRPEDQYDYNHYYFNAETLFLLLSIFLTFALEKLEIYFDENTTYPTPWVQGYEKYCHLDAGVGVIMMKNSSAYEKTCLILGANLGLILRHLIGISDLESHDPHSSWLHTESKKVVRLVIGLTIFNYMNPAISSLIGFLGFTSINPLYVALVLQPVWTLALAPTIFHLLKLGSYLEAIDDAEHPAETEKKTN